MSAVNLNVLSYPEVTHTHFAVFDVGCCCHKLNTHLAYFTMCVVIVWGKRGSESKTTPLFKFLVASLGWIITADHEISSAIVKVIGIRTSKDCTITYLYAWTHEYTQREGRPTFFLSFSEEILGIKDGKVSDLEKDNKKTFSKQTLLHARSCSLKHEGKENCGGEISTTDKNL